MRSIEELGKLYETELLPELRGLEIQRKAILGKAVAIVAVVLVLTGLAALVAPPAAVFALFIGGGIAAFVINSLSTGYRAEFKQDVIRAIVRFIDPGLRYEAGSCISQAEYLSSLIFRRMPDRYGGDDLVSGKLGRTDVMFSELHTEYKTESRDSKGHRHTHWHTIFKGLFVVSDFNKRFHGTTIVLPDAAERVLGPLAHFFQNLNLGRGQLIKLDDPEFEKLFVVYGDDQIEARYILSTSLMARIAAFRKKVGRDIYLSFTQSKMFLAISCPGEMFEPPLFRSVIGFDSVVKYFRDLQLALSIVEELNLNTRIWGR